MTSAEESRRWGPVAVTVPEDFGDAAGLYYEDPVFAHIVDLVADIHDAHRTAVCRGEFGRTLKVARPLVGVE